MSHHTVTLTWDDTTYTPDTLFTCKAPLESLCHAGWDCQCEEWSDQGVDQDGPFHITSDGDRHRGEFDLSRCGLADWFDGTSDPLRGTVTLPLVCSWNGDHVEFDVTPKVAAP